MKIICIDNNYNNSAGTRVVDSSRYSAFTNQESRQCADSNESLPHPVIFTKPDSSLLKKNKPFFLPAFAGYFWYNVSIVLKITKLGKGISAKFAHRYYDEITIGIDITAGDSSSRYPDPGLPWDLSKGFDGAAPVGEFIPVSSIENINNLNFSLAVNGITVQAANTSGMIYSPDKIIEHVSTFYTLKTGDLIFTGSPAGSGILNINDRLVADINGQELLDFLVK